MCLTKAQCEADGKHIAYEWNRFCDQYSCGQYYYYYHGGYGSTVCVTARECAGIIHGLMYTDYGNSCDTDNGACTGTSYFLDGKCIVADHCEKDGTHTANENTHTCDSKVCNGYLYDTQCLSAEECVNKGALLYKSDDGFEKLCLDKNACTNKSGYVLDNRCLTQERCQSVGRTPNSIDHTCDVKAGCGEDDYYISETECVTEDECKYKRGGYIFENGVPKMCFSRA